MGTEWATDKNDLPYIPALHMKGTIVKNRDGKTLTEFWLSRPRPRGVSIDEWEEICDAKWRRIFGTNKK